MSSGFARIYRWVAASLVITAAVQTGSHAAPSAAAAADGPALVRTYCSGCHTEHAGSFDRISDLRKTPEGWAMTVFRMRQVHGLKLDEEVRQAIVRHLADTQGLAPAEAAAGRFALEQRPNAQDLDLGPEINVMCGRCHSLARIALQRRDAEEWRKLGHTHVGQWPSIEYSASGRDRPWFQIATGPLPAKLAALYPLESASWVDWRKHVPADLSGGWVVVGHVPGGKDFYGSAQLSRGAAGEYQASYDLEDVAGIAIAGDSKAVVYTGYEWRGSATLGDQTVREVYAVSEDGNKITGRWFVTEHPEEGGDWVAVRDTGPAQILAVLPQAIRAGSSGAVTLVGVGFRAKAPVSFGEGLTAANVRQEAHAIHADVTAAATAVPGVRVVAAGGGTGHLAVYTQIDTVDVKPAYGIARVGGGRTAPVSAQFEAIAATKLPNGELLSLGPMTASWSSVPFDAEAKRTEDEKYAGHFDARGRFLPAGAGPNPGREYHGDNVGNLRVVAQVRDGAAAVEGRGHLIVTVQRWITPPIY